VEQAGARDLFRAPRHPYSLGLLNSFPSLHGPRRFMEGIPGSPPDLRDPPAGCPFHPRCGYAFDKCRAEDPPLLELGGRSAACWLQDGAREVPAVLARGDDPPMPPREDLARDARNAKPTEVQP
jgi:peptide/nickel transport system ATP-binding protein